MGHWTEFQPILGRDIRANEGVVPFTLKRQMTSKALLDRITGASYQKQLSGKNLYNVNDVDTATHDPQVDSDGWITFEFDNSANPGAIYGDYFTRVSNNLKPSTEYTIVIETEVFQGGAITIWGNTEYDSSVFPDSHVISSAGTTIVKKTTKDDLSNVDYFLRTFVTFPAKSTLKFKFRISVLEDTSVTKENFVYEPYCGGTSSPNPDYPQAIESLGDNGWYDGEFALGYLASGNIASTSNAFTSYNYIPCKEGDTIKVSYAIKDVALKSTDSICIAFYKSTKEYISPVVSKTDVNETVAPSGAAYFRFDVRHASNITVDNMGKVAVTINGKYVLKLKAVGKNLLDLNMDGATKNGLTFTVDKKAGTVTVNGTAEVTTYFPIRTYYPWKLGKYMLTGCPGKQSNATYNLAAYVGSAWNPEYGSGRIVSITKPKNIEYVDRVEIVVQKGQTLNNVVFKPMLRKCDSNDNPIGDDEFVPYIEGYSIDIPLREPLRSIGDVKDEICMRDGKYGVLRKIGVRNVRNLTCAIKDTSLPVTSKCVRFYSTEFVDRSADADKKDYIRSEKFMYITGMESDLTQEHCYFNGSEANYRFAYFMIALDKLNFETQTQANLTAAANEWLVENPVSVQYELAEPLFVSFEDQSPFYELGVLDGFTKVDIQQENQNLEPATVRVSYPINSDGAMVMDAYISGKKNELAVREVAKDKTVLHGVYRQVEVTLVSNTPTTVDVLQLLPGNNVIVDIRFRDNMTGLTTQLTEVGFTVTSASTQIVTLNIFVIYVNVDGGVIIP